MDFTQSVTLKAFASKRILITGTTGFVGKVVLEKLLRTVTGVGRIYVLIRGNRTWPSARERFVNEVATSSIFDTLREQQPELFEHHCRHTIRCITGELTESRFGLRESAFRQLGQDVDLIINAAASVDFREPLSDALNTNTLCLHTIADLALIRKIPVVHVSTCYVNGYNSGDIAEQVGPPQQGGIRQMPAGYYDVEPVIAALQQQVEAVCARVSEPKARAQALIELGLTQARGYGWNDTYTFTKWLGEQLLLARLQYNGLTILRPSIVESTLQEPVPGWIEGVKVADAIILAYAREKVTFFPGQPSAIIDIIPADLVANSIILSAAEALVSERALRIYQCCSSQRKPVRIRQVIDAVQDAGMNRYASYPNLFPRRPRRPFVMVPNLMFRLMIATLCAGLWLKTKLLRSSAASSARQASVETTLKLALIFSFYTRPDYTFSNRALLALAQRMGEVDRALFPVDPQAVDWREYIGNSHLAGLDCYSLAPRIKPVQSRVRQREHQAA